MKKYIEDTFFMHIKNVKLKEIVIDLYIRIASQNISKTIFIRCVNILNENSSSN